MRHIRQRLSASYLVIPLLVPPFLWWNVRSSRERLVAASLAAAGATFALAVIFDVLQGLTRPCLL